MYELLTRQNLATELRSVFQPPNQPGVLYLEARFMHKESRYGIDAISLSQFLHSWSTVKMSTLAIVPPADYKNTLLQVKTNAHVFAAGEWVHVNHGLYKGDVGLCVNSDVGHVDILLVPRIPLTTLPEETEPEGMAIYPEYQLKHKRTQGTEKSTEGISKRKRASGRPEPHLFQPTLCPPGDVLLQTLPPLAGALDDGRRQCYKHRVLGHFEHGLLLNTFSSVRLSTASTITGNLRELLYQSGHPEIRKRPMLLPDDWHFATGDEVMVELANGVQDTGMLTECGADFVVIETTSQGLHRVPWVNLRDSICKMIFPGDYIVVQTGMHANKSGLVAAKTGRLLGIIPDHVNNIVEYIFAPCTGTWSYMILAFLG